MLAAKSIFLSSRRQFLKNLANLTKEGEPKSFGSENVDPSYLP